MNFVPYSALVRDTVALSRRLPRAKIRGVLGIARSGLLPASIIAQETGLHLGDVHTFARTGEFYRPGSRLVSPASEAGPLLVVDDSLYSGRTLNTAREVLQGHDLVTAAVYVAPGREDTVDFHARTVSAPRMFGWNWTGSSLLGRVLCDMDGILCHDTDVYDDDGQEYHAALRDARPFRALTKRLGVIVTCRLERWRETTEAWLEANAVRYKKLVMAPFPTASERRAFGNAKWKASVYDEHSGALLFIESSIPQAREIAKRTGRLVLCPAAGRVF